MHDVQPKVLHDDRHHLLDVNRVQLEEAGERLRRLPPWHLGIVLDLLNEAVVAFVGGVVPQYVHDEALLDRLPHAVLVERGGAGWARLVKEGLRLELRRGREGEEAKVGLLSPL